MFLILITLFGFLLIIWSAKYVVLKLVTHFWTVPYSKNTLQVRLDLFETFLKYFKASRWKDMIDAIFHYSIGIFIHCNYMKIFYNNFIWETYVGRLFLFSLNKWIKSILSLFLLKRAYDFVLFISFSLYLFLIFIISIINLIKSIVRSKSSFLKQ